MNDVLDREITGEPLTVTLAGAAHPLAYKLHAVLVYKQLTGDSLFDPESWQRISPQTDPVRFRACLYAGLHQQQADKSWKAPFTLDELDGLIGFDNAGEISVAMVKAAAQDMPKPREPEPKNDPAPAAVIPTPAPTTSASSGPVPVSVSA